MSVDPALAFAVREHETPAFEVRVNFGVFAGRSATPAEIDELARRIARDVVPFSIVSEERHEFGEHVEASLHMVRIEVPRETANGDLDALAERLVLAASAWAEACIADRHTEF
jgi:hypothetical protein